MVQYLDTAKIFVDHSNWALINWLEGDMGLFKDRNSGETFLILTEIFADVYISVMESKAEPPTLKKIKNFVSTLREKHFPEFVGIMFDEGLRNEGQDEEVDPFGIFPVFNYLDHFDYPSVQEYLWDLARAPLISSYFYGFSIVASQEEEYFQQHMVVTFDAIGFRQLRNIIVPGNLFAIDLAPLRNFTEKDWEQFCFGLYYFDDYFSFDFVKDRRRPPTYLIGRFDSNSIEIHSEINRLEEFFADFVGSLLWYREEEALEIAQQEVKNDKRLSEIIGILREETILRKYRQ